MNHLPIVVLPNVDDVITPLVDLLERQDLYFSQYVKEAGAHQKPIIFFPWQVTTRITQNTG